MHICSVFISMSEWGWFSWRCNVKKTWQTFTSGSDTVTQKSNQQSLFLAFLCTISQKNVILFFLYEVLHIVHCILFMKANHNIIWKKYILIVYIFINLVQWIHRHVCFFRNPIFSFFVCIQRYIEKHMYMPLHRSVSGRGVKRK